MCGDNQVRGIQECASAKAAWEKLPSRYAEKAMVNRLDVLHSLLITKLERNPNTGDHVTKLKCQFTRFASLCFITKK